MKNIDLSEWEQTGGGAFGVTYFHKSDPSTMLKFMDETIAVESVEQELENSRKVYELGVKTPKPGELITDGNRIGMTFQRIVGKRSYARATGEEPQRIPEFAARYARLVKELHSIPCDTTRFMDVRQMYGGKIKENPFRSAEVKEKLLRLMDTLPHAATCLHGDLHFGNVIMTETADYFIDLGNFCYGCPLYDFSMPYLLVRFVPEERILDGYHCTREQAALFLQESIRSYFVGSLSFDEFEEQMLPYMAIRYFTTETEMGIVPPGEVAPFFLEYLKSL